MVMQPRKQGAPLGIQHRFAGQGIDPADADNQRAVRSKIRKLATVDFCVSDQHGCTNHWELSEPSARTVE